MSGFGLSSKPIQGRRGPARAEAKGLVVDLVGTWAWSPVTPFTRQASSNGSFQWARSSCKISCEFVFIVGLSAERSALEKDTVLPDLSASI